MPSEPEFTAEDGSVRKSHYGAGRQPWDDIVDLGWGPYFAAGNVLKYVRRHAAKNGEDDLMKARWYCRELVKMCADPAMRKRSRQALADLDGVLTYDERALLMFC